MSDTVATDRSLILAGDCLERMAELPEGSIDAICTDPPYGLEFMGKEWDRLGGGKVEHARPGENSSGFFNHSGHARLGMEWKAGAARAMQAWHERWATEAFRLLKPGGHLIAFGGSRTYHRLASAIEDAGFEIRDQLLWIYGSGFPKSLDVSKAIDKRAGAEREVIGHVEGGGRMSGDPDYKSGDYGASWHGVTVTEPATDEARAWDGWGTALKPAHEPIVLARKPLVGSVAENVLEHGTGALNIGGTKVGAKGGTRQTRPKPKPDEQAVTSFGKTLGSAPGGNEDAGGRWPANVILAHLPDCKGTTAAHTDKLCAPGCPVAELNETSGESTTPAMVTRGAKGGEFLQGVRQESQRYPAQGDSGGAARFFYVAKTKRRERIAGVERNLHPTVKPVELMRWLIRLVTPPGGVVLDPFLGSGSTGCAAAAEHVRFIGIERESEYLDIARARIADWLFAHPEG